MKRAGLTFIRWAVKFFGYEVVRPHPTERPWLEDVEFMQLYKNIQSHTVVSIGRLFMLFMLYQYARHAVSLAGDIAEVGVYKGGTAKLFLFATKNTTKQIHLFDTFEGMPGAETHAAFSSERALFVDTSLEAVREFLHDGRVVFYKGVFPGTAQGFDDTRFSLVYLDADLYDSTKNGLEFFWPKMVPGGVLAVDDYGSQYWPGIKDAVHEFAAAQKISPIRTAPFQCAFIKH